MATLVREPVSLRTPARATAAENLDLRSNVPAPFPKDLAQELLDELAAEDLGLDTVSVNPEPSTRSHQQEVGPSLTHVEQSCLMTLNNLLSQYADDWQPIVPTRRHSMPAQSPTTTSVSFQALLPTPTPSSALHTLVTNLRHRYDSPSRELGPDDDTALLRELDDRVTSLVNSGSIQSRDAHLAQSLVSLLTHLGSLSALSPAAPHRSPVDLLQAHSTTDIYDTLRRQVSELQSHRDAHAPLDNDTRQTPVRAVEHAMLWSKIDNDLDEVFRLCRERAEPVPRPYSPEAPSLPPEYDVADYEPPTYDPAEYSETAAAKAAQNAHKPTSSVHLQTQHTQDEKMRLDLEAVTMAIDRLYLVAPQLSNQRVELNGAKLEKMKQARDGGSNTVVEGWRASRARRKGKAKEILGNGLRERGAPISGGNLAEEDAQDLENLFELLGKASARRMNDQSVVLDGERGMAERIEKARLRDLEKRDAFHEQLVTHSNAGRLTSQDAVLHKHSIASLNTRTRNPDALLTLPEFIREAIPDTVDQARDPETLLSLPEFVREKPPPGSSAHESGNNLIGTSTAKLKKPFKPPRSRSLSAPPLSLAWLLPGSTVNSRTPSPLSESKSTTSGQSGGNGRNSPLRAGLDVQYVAEYQENLGSVTVFLQVSGQQAGFDIEAEVFPYGGERLVVKCGASTSAPLALPARVVPGKREVKVQGGHLEVKLECISGPANGHVSQSGDTTGTGLLDASQLRALNPTSFICASCSLPLVQSSRLSRYDDLPSEHWAELLEAWMCHSDQRLSDRIALYTTGLWPSPGQALVGGSYILFESSCLVGSNFRCSEASKTDDLEHWQPVRCICGAVTGRYRRHTSLEGTYIYRLAKYAIRPVSPLSDPMKIPLSAFVLQDMDEFVHAHATYRFVLLDDEEEKPRILIWMFNPSMRISYATSTHNFIPRCASIQVAKVHFKIPGPSVSPTLKSTLEKYPGFGQSERLLYPLDVCRRLAGLLKESNLSYPQGRRVMGGLDVGWLLRA
ncbi:HECT-like ubiquitin-conjugating enzyme-binding-domain-containing protein [Gautieria morchelliformis]|nr:HECT-like ubiquitin-conjugating enzyme-binding-domain-containing protein [Gautieria morchelliformis]